ncbi:MAG: lactate racemase domain-containing protein [Blastochloris sp.]|nr:lactate racemase domain-containing protein [Blastochloris sp.]
MKVQDVMKIGGVGGAVISDAALSQFLLDVADKLDADGKRILLIVPDATRTAPIGTAFKTLHAALSARAKEINVIFALGTHPPMSEEAMCQRLEITQEERQRSYHAVQMFNHAWDDPNELHTLGAIPRSEISDLSDALFSMDVPVQINRRVFDHDLLLIIGPVFPHEVVGFSGGNKYLFPGIGGPEILNFFHWLGAVVTNARIIGSKWTPVRRVVDRAAAMVPVERKCLCLLVDSEGTHGAFFGTPEMAWDMASDASAQLHVVRKPRAFHSILSCAPLMYDELWVGGKCMYKLEPVLDDGGELIIYAPHIHEVSVTHGKLISQIGYHCRDYFLKQWDKFKDFPWGILAHSTHVYGQGTYENGVERPRAKVTLATGIDEATCRQINLGYRNWRTIRKEDFMDREDSGVLFVPKAGEQLYRLESPPAWARER